MNIILTGGTGFLGRHLSKYLTNIGHTIKLIQRSDINEGISRISKLINSADVLINLAGSPVIKKWSDRNKNEILSSRLDTTNLLVEAILGLNPENRPKMVLSASAIGIYDSSGIHQEDSRHFDDNFLSFVCEQWEKCLDPLKNQDVRICIMRIGIVLGSEGGMLKQLLPIFMAGIGGPIGNGKQPFSFIHYQDFCRAVEYLMENPKCEGVFNMVSPEPTTNKIFTKELARICHRPAIFPVPAFALKILYGKAAVAMINGQAVYPGHLLECGFKFEFADIHSAVKAAIIH
ncbi:MAG: TIGR01777 family oxidoreductase [Prolixibacteraceae bacterium]